ncbi:RNA polymerase sigma factor [Dokdonia donghaensis]|uniref:RNA polymerase sigma-70 factor n=1 Tax=Dokdonia donghaensis DSW-1 TaxID=1300343 RepID=A0A0A2GUH7_9FLAO|nr:sigma-70 family RNA polymerase sigma factor [Dokdonia donghaensis]ANH59479.1 ECF RNA polymerase sigma factor SigW [Dokdonia donghaensis DSW-1]KGO06862.1 RNA polymerase sigma-70 factor [Dokdonia donghaensis DSW-1]
MSQDQLIKNCKKKQPKAQADLYKRYASVLFSVCLKYAPNYTEAEDILQDAFITIFDKITQYKNKGSFEGWLKRVVINTALQRYRKPGVYSLVNEENIKEVEVEVEEDAIPLDYLLSIIQELPDRYRMVFNLYVMDGYSHREISELLTISQGTSKSNLARARMILKEKIETSLHSLQTKSHL